MNQIKIINGEEGTKKDIEIELSANLEVVWGYEYEEGRLESNFFGIYFRDSVYGTTLNLDSVLELGLEEIFKDGEKEKIW